MISDYTLQPHVGVRLSRFEAHTSSYARWIFSEIEHMMQIDNNENNENIENKNTFQLFSWHHNRGRLRYPSSMCRRPRGLSFLQLFEPKSAHFLLFQVFPEGLVASDGRLQPGDQIIEINGADMTCATHAQVKIMEAGV